MVGWFGIRVLAWGRDPILNGQAIQLWLARFCLHRWPRRSMTSMATTSSASASPDARRCKGQTKTGTQCRAHPGKSGWCTFHDPALGGARARGRVRGGQRHRTPAVADISKVQLPIRDTAGVMRLLDVAAEDTLAQPNSTYRSRALVTISLAFLKGIEIGQLEQRLIALEEMFRATKKYDH